MKNQFFIRIDNFEVKCWDVAFELKLLYFEISQNFITVSRTLFFSCKNVCFK